MIKNNKIFGIILFFVGIANLSITASKYELSDSYVYNTLRAKPLEINHLQVMKDKWDDVNKTYTNYTCNFYWRLNEDCNWKKQPLMQQNAIFGAVDAETRTVAYVTAIEMQGCDSDDYIWEHES